MSKSLEQNKPISSHNIEKSLFFSEDNIKPNFCKATNSYLISDFVEIQRKSFFELLETGLMEEFSKRNPITNKNLEIFFYPEYYQLTPPEYNPRRAILLSKSYSSKLFIPAQLTDKKLKKSKLKWVLIGNLPLMTKRGHFVLNGAPRVIVNQIIRSPGIYFHGSLKEIFSDKWSEKPEITYKRFYTDLICLRGTWLRIEIDKNKDIWAQMKKVPKIPLLWFLLAMGLTERIIFKSVINPTRLLANFNLDIKRKRDYEYVSNASDAWKEISNLISPILAPLSTPLAPPPNKPLPSNPVKGVAISEAKKQRGVASLPSIPLPLTPLLKKTEFFLKGGKGQGVTVGIKARGKGGIKKENKLTIDKNFTSETPSSPLGGDQIANHTLDLEKKTASNLSKPLTTLFSKQQNCLDPLSIGRGRKADENIKNGSVSVNNFADKSKEGRNWIFKRFMNPRAYDLGKQGRLNFNRKLGLKISSNQTTLTAQDLLFATDYLLKVETGLKNMQGEALDHLKNRRVRTSGELLQIQIGIGLVRLEKLIREKFSKINAQTRALRSKEFLTSRSNNPKIRKIQSNEAKKNRNSKLKVLLLSKMRKLTGLSCPPVVLRPYISSLPPFRGVEASVATRGRDKEAASKGGVKAGALAANCSNLNVFYPKRALTSPRALLGAPLLPHPYPKGVGVGMRKPNKQGGELKRLSPLLQNISKGVTKATKVQKKLSIDEINNLINTKAFNGALREFFGSSQLSQFMDQLNPLAEITHKRRLSSMGPGGVTRDSATLAIRGIHPTHYGRICPIETPEGKNTGLVNSLTTYARANSQGFLESPFYKVYKGQIQKNAGMFYLSAEQEENIKLAAADVSSPLGRLGFLPKSKMPAKVAYGDTISFIKRNNVEYIGVSPIQMISIATSLIPFLEHDDANRALMGSNMQRQAVPLIRTERPLVGTGLESRAVSDSGHAVIAKDSGYVAYVSAKKILIFTLASL